LEEEGVNTVIINRRGLLIEQSLKHEVRRQVQG
jgi:hypothetical protein